MHRFQAPHRLLLIALLLAMLPIRAGLAWAPGEEAAGPAGDQGMSVQMTLHGDAGCCAGEDATNDDLGNSTCTATCACCAVLAATVTAPSATVFAVPPTSLFALVHNPHPVPLRPPRFLRS